MPGWIVWHTGRHLAIRTRLAMGKGCAPGRSTRTAVFMNQQALEIKLNIPHPMRRDLVVNLTVCILCIKVVKVRQLKQREDSHHQRIRLSGDHGRKRKRCSNLHLPHAYAGGIIPPASLYGVVSRSAQSQQRKARSTCTQDQRNPNQETVDWK